MGLARAAGRALALHGDVAKLAFTGSTDIGKLMLLYAGQSNLKAVSLECGGKSPNLVFAVAISGLRRRHAPPSASSSTRAKCAGPGRASHPPWGKDAFRRPFREPADPSAPGDPLDPATTVGARTGGAGPPGS